MGDGLGWGDVGVGRGGGFGMGVIPDKAGFSDSIDQNAWVTVEGLFSECALFRSGARIYPESSTEEGNHG